MEIRRNLNYKAKIKELTNKNSICLNLGSNEEPTPEYLREVKCKFYGIDSEEGLCYNEFLKQCDLEKEEFPFKDNSFDVVVSTFLIEHLKNPERVFKEVQRVLKKNGSFVFLTPNYKHPIVFFNKYLPLCVAKFWVNGLLNSNRKCYPAYYNCNTLKKIKSFSKKYGFKIKEAYIFGTVGSYFRFNKTLQRIAEFTDSLIKNKPTLFVILQK